MLLWLIVTFKIDLCILVTTFEYIIDRINALMQAICAAYLIQETDLVRLRLATFLNLKINSAFNFIKVRVFK
jgi:hypothetical protein